MNVAVKANTLTLQSANNQLIGKSLSYYEDASDTLSVVDVYKNVVKFTPITNDVFSKIATSSAYWLSGKIKNQTQQDICMNIFNANLTELLMYKIDASGSIVDSIRTSCLIPMKKRKLDSYTFQFPILDKSDTATYHFLIKAKSHLPMEIPVYVGSYPEIQKTEKMFNYMSLFFIGGSVLMLLYNLFLFFVTHDKIYVYYVCYLLAGVFIATYASNFPIIQHIIGVELTHNQPATWFWATFIFTALFTIEYFHLKQNAPRYYTLLRVQMALFLLFGVLNLFVPTQYLTNGYQLLIVVFYLTCISLGVYMLFQGNDRAKLFCIGWSALIIGTFSHLATYNGFLPYNPLLRSATYIGALTEILVFAIALGQIINKLRIEQAELNQSLINKNNDLTALNASLDSFNYHVSHDLKTVLNNSQSLAKMILKYNATNNTQKVEEIVTKLEQVTKNGVQTVNSFLKLGVVDNMLSDVELESVNIKESIDKVQTTNGLSDQININIQTENFDSILIHRESFESIVLNFITNSIKYNEQFPEAYFKFYIAQNSMNIVYADNGIGIDLKKDGEKLFKPFQRIKNNVRTKGTGVGLYLVKRIIDTYNGTISVSSKPGFGIRFHIKYPISCSNDND